MISRNKYHSRLHSYNSINNLLLHVASSTIAPRKTVPPGFPTPSPETTSIRLNRLAL